MTTQELEKAIRIRFEAMYLSAPPVENIDTAIDTAIGYHLPTVMKFIESIRQSDKATYRAEIMEKMPKKQARPESGANRNGTAQAVRKAYNSGLGQCKAAIDSVLGGES